MTAIARRKMHTRTINFSEANQSFWQTAKSAEYLTLSIALTTMASLDPSLRMYGTKFHESSSVSCNPINSDRIPALC